MDEEESFKEDGQSDCRHKRSQNCVFVVWHSMFLFEPSCMVPVLNASKPRPTVSVAGWVVLAF